MDQAKPKRKVGAPKGNRNGAHDKPWANALRRAILANNAVKLRSIAEAVIRKAEGGDTAAIREIGDRLDGKAVQPVQGDVDMNLTVEVLRFGDR